MAVVRTPPISDVAVRWRATTSRSPRSRRRSTTARGTVSAKLLVRANSTGNCWAMAAVTDALRLAAPVANALRRVTPIISAVVVAAVRRGLRVALATASRPGTRRVRPLTVPSSRPAGPTRCGLPSTRFPAVSAPRANNATMLPAATASHSAPAPASSSRTAAVPATQPGRVALATAWLRMAARGADAAQQRELPAALGHEDGEGVVDDERRHQQGDPAEQQEHGVELAGLAGDLFGGALAQLVAGAHGDGAAEGLGRVAPQRRLADAVPGDQVDAVVAARAEEPPQGLGRDRGHAAVLVVQEGGAETRVDGADERERLDPPLGGDPHAVALAQAELLGGGRVDGDLAGGRGQPPAGRVLPAQPRVGRDGDAERPLPAVRGVGTAVAVEDAHPVGQARLGDGDARDRAGGVERRLVEPSVVAGGDGGVDAALRLREAVVEGGAERVGEDQRAGDEADAEHDGEDGRGQPAAVGKQPAEGGAQHRVTDPLPARRGGRGPR